MTYEMIVNKVREDFEKADAATVKGHMAIQFHITGEGHGIFYVEITDGRCNVQPYDYRDNDITVIADADPLLAYTSAAETFRGLMDAGKIQVYGNTANTEILNGFFKKPVKIAETVIPAETVVEKETAAVEKKAAAVEENAATAEKEAAAPAKATRKAARKTTAKSTAKSTEKDTAKKTTTKSTTTRKTTSRKKTA